MSQKLFKLPCPQDFCGFGLTQIIDISQKRVAFSI